MGTIRLLQWLQDSFALISESVALACKLDDASTARDDETRPQGDSTHETAL